MFGRELIRICDDNELPLSDPLFLRAESFTYFSEAHHSTSWLDHCVSSPLGHHRILDMEVDYSFQSSDHFPLHLAIALPLDTHAMGTATPVAAVTPAPPLACWSKASEEDIQVYNQSSS